MHARRSAVALALSLLLVWVGIARPAAATVVVPLSLEELAQHADLVARGTVVQTGALLSRADGPMEPHTRSELRVREVIRGAASDHVTIDEIGGEVNGEGRWIDGTPRYAPGDEVVVFLRALPAGEAHRTVGMAQGRFSIVQTVDAAAHRLRPMVERDTRALSFATWPDGAMQLAPGARSIAMRYEDFVARVRAASP